MLMQITASKYTRFDYILYCAKQIFKLLLAQVDKARVSVCFLTSYHTLPHTILFTKIFVQGTLTNHSKFNYHIQTSSGDSTLIISRYFQNVQSVHQIDSILRSNDIKINHNKKPYLGKKKCNSAK